MADRCIMFKLPREGPKLVWYMFKFLHWVATKFVPRGAEV